MKKQYTAQEIAEYYINIANSEVIDEGGVCESITNLKLQKILYFAQAAHLSVYNKPLFKEEIEAWKFGPVVPSVYHKYKHLGNKPIEDIYPKLVLTEDLKTFLNSVWTIYGKFSAAELVEITHNHKPWKEAFYNNADKDNVVISQEYLKQHYKGYYHVEI